MILKPKPIDQLTDEQLDQKLKNTAKQEKLYDAAKENQHHPIAGVIAVVVMGIAIAIWKLSWATGNPFIIMGGMVAGTAELVVGMFAGSAIWTRTENALRGLWRKTEDDVGKEKKKRAWERTAEFKEEVKQAAIATARKIRDAFNSAVDKTFHGGTEKDIKVKGPLQLKKPGEPKKKKFPFGF
jgi:hypothetical protein